MKESKVVDLPGWQRMGQIGKEKLLDRLYHEHRAALRAFLWVRTGSEEDREDIIQDVFVRLARIEDLASKAPLHGDSTRSFLIKIANNLVLDDERRRLTSHGYLETEQNRLQEQAVSQVSPEDSLLVGRDLARAKAAIMQLKPRWRQAFVLNRFGNKSYREIASQMGVSAKQVEKYMQQAMAHLRKAGKEIRGRE